MSERNPERGQAVDRLYAVTAVDLALARLARVLPAEHVATYIKGSYYPGALSDARLDLEAAEVLREATESEPPRRV